jgi:subtilisin family serine protease
MSFGGPATTSALSGAVAYAAGKGALLAAAAGNSGVDSPFFPAAHSEVIGVAATDEADVLYGWSNRGDWVEVSAPGCNTAPGLEGGYVEFCGTSSAAPVVSAIAGLALSLDPAASKNGVEQGIAGNATPLPEGARFGRVNAPSVMTAVSPTGTLLPLQPPTPAPAPPCPPAPGAAGPGPTSRPRAVAAGRVRSSARDRSGEPVAAQAPRRCPRRSNASRHQRCVDPRRRTPVISLGSLRPQRGSLPDDPAGEQADLPGHRPGSWPATPRRRDGRQHARLGKHRLGGVGGRASRAPARATCALRAR